MQILFRPSLETQEELKIARKYLPITTSRVQCNGLTIGRYSVLPYYQELEHDLANRKNDKYDIVTQEKTAWLINTYKQHKWIANFEYYNELSQHTPKIWFDDNFYTCEYPGPFVVKGKTNGRKFQWNTQMYAETKKDAINLGAELSQNEHIGPQGIVYRKYVPLETYEYGLNGLPFTNEWRFFYLDAHCLSYGYYWSCAKNLPSNDSIELSAIKFADNVARIVSKHVRFFVLDIAKTQDGNWILIEINDGQMSGLSENDPHILYKNLYKYLF